MHFLKSLGLLVFAAFATNADTVKVQKTPHGPARLEIHSDPGAQITIEGAHDLKTWSLLSILSAPEGMVEFVDDHNHDGGEAMFYRVTASAGSGQQMAANFRMTDHTGRSRELYYYFTSTNVSAFVLVFTANGCQSIEDALPELKALQSQYASQKIQFWMVNSKAGDTRASIAQEATRLGITWPVMHDRAQSVASVYGVEEAPFAVLIKREDMSVYYKGSLDSGDGTASALAQALSDFSSGAPKTSANAHAEHGCGLNLPTHAEISYATQIAPILQAKCVTCHTPGNVAPWYMTNYAVVKQYAPLMESEILARRMPPWHADPQYGTFSNDISLTIDEETMLLAWIRNGAPRGEGTDPLLNVPPPAPKWPVELGPPDMIIKCPEQDIAPTGEEPYRYVFVQSNIPSNVWVKASIVKPSNYGVVHHYLVWEGQETQQMASGMAGYVPGSDQKAFPPNTGIILNKNTWLTFNLHYTPTGKAEKDQPELALWFHRTPPAKRLETLPLLTPILNIPPGAPDHQVSATIPVFQQTTIYRLSPHMHVRGSWMKFEVEYPNRTKEILLSVPKYEFHWQTGYYLASPKVIPAGSRLIVTGGFDNSPQNPHNPDPTATVHWGDQSWDEMFIGYFDFTF